MALEEHQLVIDALHESEMTFIEACKAVGVTFTPTISRRIRFHIGRCEGPCNRQMKRPFLRFNSDGIYKCQDCHNTW